MVKPRTKNTTKVKPKTKNTTKSKTKNTTKSKSKSKSKTKTKTKSKNQTLIKLAGITALGGAAIIAAKHINNKLNNKLPNNIPISDFPVLTSDEFNKKITDKYNCTRRIIQTDHTYWVCIDKNSSKKVVLEEILIRKDRKYIVTENKINISKAVSKIKDLSNYTFRYIDSFIYDNKLYYIHEPISDDFNPLVNIKFTKNNLMGLVKVFPKIVTNLINGLYYFHKNEICLNSIHIENIYYNIKGDIRYSSYDIACIKKCFISISKSSLFSPEISTKNNDAILTLQEGRANDIWKLGMLIHKLIYEEIFPGLGNDPNFVIYDELIWKMTAPSDIRPSIEELMKFMRTKKIFSGVIDTSSWWPFNWF